MQQAQKIIDQAWDDRASLQPAAAPRELREAIEFALAGLDSGSQRVAEKRGSAWVTHQWLKKAVLLYFRTHDNVVMDAGYTRFYDKVPLKHARYDAAEFAAGGVRVVPNLYPIVGGADAGGR